MRWAHPKKASRIRCSARRTNCASSCRIAVEAMLKRIQCENFEDLAVLYAAGEMEEPQRRSVEEHARACAECGSVLQREMELAELLSASSQRPDDADLLLAECRQDLSVALEQQAPKPKDLQW